MENIFWICNVWTIFKLDIFSKTGAWGHGRPCMLLSFYIPFSSTGDKTRWRNSKGNFGSACNPQGGLKDWVAKCWIVLSFLLWQTRKSKYVSYCLMEHYFKTGGDRGGISPAQAEQLLKVGTIWMWQQHIWCVLLWCHFSCKNWNAGSWYLHVWSLSHMKGSVLQTVHSFQLHTWKLDEFDFSSCIFRLTISFCLLLA